MNAGYVYVLGFDDGTVKIGRTQDSKSRLKTHRSNARRWGRTITDFWVSPLHLEWDLNEDTLKVIAAKCGGLPVSPEFFTGADYAAIVSAASRLPFTSPAEETAGRILPCLKGRGKARECAIRVGALDAKVREMADATHATTWNRVRATCVRCA